MVDCHEKDPKFRTASEQGSQSVVILAGDIPDNDEASDVLLAERVHFALRYSTMAAEGHRLEIPFGGELILFEGEAKARIDPKLVQGIENYTVPMAWLIEDAAVHGQLMQAVAKDPARHDLLEAIRADLTDPILRLNGAGLKAYTDWQTAKAAQNEATLKEDFRKSGGQKDFAGNIKRAVLAEYEINGDDPWLVKFMMRFGTKIPLIEYLLSFTGNRKTGDSKFVHGLGITPTEARVVTGLEGFRTIEQPSTRQIPLFTGRSGLK